MAPPNLAVKSESWLDLTADTRHAHQARGLPATGVDGSRQCSPLACRRSLPPPSKQAAASKQQQHELIRLRQRSYLSQRSQATSLSSLSSSQCEQSSGNPIGQQQQQQQSLIITGQDRACFGRQVESNINNNNNNSKSRSGKPLFLSPSSSSSLLAPSSNRRESIRLTRLRQRLSGSGASRRQFCKISEFQSYDYDDFNRDWRHESEIEKHKSPLKRSWSSLSERLNGKLSDIRHSWKHFLYQRASRKRTNRNGEDEDEDFNSIDEQTRQISAINSSNLSPSSNSILSASMSLDCFAMEATMDKCKLTSDWLNRHYAQNNRLPRSYSHFEESDDDNATTRAATFAPAIKLSQHNRPKSLQLLDKSVELTTSDKTTTTVVKGQGQIAASLERIQSDACISQRGRPSKGERNRQAAVRTELIKQQVSSPQSSTATLVSGAAPIERISVRESPGVGASTRVAPASMQQHNPATATEQTSEIFAANSTNKANWLAKAPTSDYWSTIASSELYKQQQQVAGNSDGAAAAGQLLVPMGADQDYYLDVAAAAAADQRGAFAVQCLAGNKMQRPLATPNLDDYDEDYAVPADESCRLDRSQVELVQLIGEGQKGYVFLGKLQSKDGGQIVDVAIKTLKYETGQLIEKLMREAAMMRQLEHPHIVRFIGVCPETPALIAMELAQFGEVKHYFKLNRQLITVPQLVLFTFQISTALSYLESKNYVHRDVAARNVLVCSHNCVKLADFGLSRSLQPAPSSRQLQRHRLLQPPAIGRQPEFALYQDQDQDADEQDDESQYVAAPRVKLPVRWLAPESLVFRRFTSASDVWMFAVCGWELFHLCQLRPWASIRNNQVLAAIEAGQRLPRPPGCPARLYQLMLQCWSYAPVQRPKFREIKQCIWSIYLNERAKQQLEIEQQQQQQQQQLQQQQQKEKERLLASRLVAVSQPRQQPEILIPTPVPRQALEIAASKQRSDKRNIVIPQAAGYASGYSSATPTATELSANSSRSSSMGSLARQQAIANRLLQHPVLVAPQGARSSCSPSAARCASQAPEEAPARRQVDRESVEANARRFRKAPGHVLQKQRSQGSIGMSPAGASLGGAAKVTRDDWIGRRHARLAAYEEDDGDDEDNSTSGDEEDEGARQQGHAYPGGRLLPEEPSYEGVQAGAGQRVIEARAQPASSASGKFWRPASWRAEPTGEPARGSPGSRSNPERAHHTRFGNLLQSLGMVPMKAKLVPTHSVQAGRQSSAEPAGARAGQRQRRHLAAPTPTIVESRANQAEAAADEEEQERQLAVHQRLLGRIRPASVASNRSGADAAPRRSVHLPAAQNNSQVSSVDQSLQLLESLMSDEDKRKQQQQQQQQHQQHHQRQSSLKAKGRRPMW